MVKRKQMTIKQEKFVQEYIKNDGNGTQAALVAYDTTDPVTASAIARETLESPLVAQAVAISRAQFSDNVRQILDKCGAMAHVVYSAMQDIQHDDPKVRAMARKDLIELGKSLGFDGKQAADGKIDFVLPKR